MKSAPTIRIKLIVRGQPGTVFISQLPATGSFTGECSFHDSLSEDRYDWLVVIDDVSRKLGAPPESLACADEHTLLVTTEPQTITNYGRGFTRQFAHVLTSQSEKSLPHPNRIFSHTGNLWFNGHTYDQIHGNPLPGKSLGLSTVCSAKQQKHTLHNDRYQFCHWLMQRLPDMDLFGHGSRYIEKKYDALDPYRYHLAIENYVGPHHWTEKLADPFLSGCFPIYYGCENIGDYFTSDSYLEIDIYKREEALDLIRAITENPRHYPASLEALCEARRRVMNEYNLLSMIEEIVLKNYQSGIARNGRLLYGRKQMRCRNPLDALDHLRWETSKYLKR